MIDENLFVASCASDLTNGKVKLLLPGETSASGKYYKVLITTGISNGTRVIVAKISGTYVVISAFNISGGGGGGSGTVTSVGITNGGGLSVSGSPVTSSGSITVGHSNSVTAKTTQALYPIKFDSYGHITGAGSAVPALPTVTGTDNGKILKVVSGAWAAANESGGGSVPEVGSITMTTSWSGAGPYTQTVTVSGGPTVTSASMVDLQPDAAAIAQLISDGVQALYIVNNSGTLTATAVGAAPTASLTLQCTVTETA